MRTSGFHLERTCSCCRTALSVCHGNSQGHSLKWLLLVYAMAQDIPLNAYSLIKRSQAALMPFDVVANSQQFCSFSVYKTQNAREKRPHIPSPTECRLAFIIIWLDLNTRAQHAYSHSRLTDSHSYAHYTWPQWRRAIHWTWPQCISEMVGKSALKL